MSAIVSFGPKSRTHRMPAHLPKHDIHQTPDTSSPRANAGLHPLLAMVRILAQIAARDWLNLLHTLPPIAESSEHEPQTDVAGSAITRKEDPT